MLKQKIARIAAFTAALTGTATVLHAYPFGPGPGFAGAPGDATCAQCHGGGAVNKGGGSIELNLTSYTAGSRPARGGHHPGRGGAPLGI